MAIPEQPEQLYDPRGVSLARMISNEFGTSESTAHSQLGKHDTVIEIDGVKWDGDHYFVPRDKLVGRRIVVLAPERHWSFMYPADQ